MYVAGIIVSKHGQLVAEDLWNGYDAGALEAVSEYLQEKGISVEELMPELEPDELVYKVDDRYFAIQRTEEGYKILKSERMDDMECVKVDYKEFEAMTIQHSKDLLQAGELRATSEIGRDEVALNGLSRAEVERGVLYHAQSILEEMGLENEVELLAARVHGVPGHGRIS